MAGDDGEEGLAFWIHVTPRSRRPGVGGLQGDALRVAVAEAPEAGRATAACQAALARAFGVPRAAVALDPGSRHRRKRVRIHGARARLKQRFDALADPAGLG